MKYLVMECHAGYVVLLDEEGCFVKAANFHYQVGETVEDPVLMKEPVPSKKRRIRAITGLAAAAACFLLMFNSYYQNYLYTDTAIYLTINPSVCMELNRKGDVVRLSGANEDGETLLEDYHRSSNDRLEVVDELIDRAIEMGYLSEGGLVTIDIDAPDEVHFQKYGVELRTNLTEYLENQLVVEIQIIDHDAKDEEPEDVSSDAAGESLQEQEPKETEPAATIPIEQTKTEPQQTVPSKEDSQAAESAPVNPETSSPAPARNSQPPAASSDRKEEEETDYGTDYEVPEPKEDDEDDGTDYDPDPGTDYETPDDTSDDGITDYGSDYDTDDPDEEDEKDLDEHSDKDDEDGSDYESSDYR